MNSRNISYVLYLTLLFGSACYAAPLTSAPSLPNPRPQEPYGNSSTYGHTPRLNRQRSKKSVVPIYQILQHGHVSELMVQEPESIELRSQFRVDNLNAAKAGINNNNEGDTNRNERKLFRRYLQSDARNAFRRFFRYANLPSISATTNGTLTSTLPTATAQANSTTGSLSIETSVTKTPEPISSDLTALETVTTAQETTSSVESAPTISTSSVEATQTGDSSIGLTSVADSSTTPGLTIASETATSVSSAPTTATSSVDIEATQTEDPSIGLTSEANALITPTSTTANEITDITTSSTTTDQTSADPIVQTTSSTIDETTTSTPTTSDVATTSPTDSNEAPTETPMEQLQYWGGTMMVEPVNVYHIFYGNWSSFQRQVVDDFITNFPSTSYWTSILPTYTDNTGTPATTSATLQGSVVEDYTHGLVLDDQSVEDVISEVILSGRLGEPDPNGIYMIMTDKDVAQTSGFCETYCGYHDFFDVQGVQIKYGYMGDPTQCIVGCSPANPVNSPNNDPGLDSVISILLHELIEIITDPVPPTGWIDGFGNENGDLCAYSYGGVKRLSSGAFFNQEVGGRKYLVQLMWAMDVNGCRS